MVPADGMFASVATGVAFYLSGRLGQDHGDAEGLEMGLINAGFRRLLSHKEELSDTSSCLMESREGNDWFLYDQIRRICHGLTRRSSGLTPGAGMFGRRLSLVFRAQVVEAAEKPQRSHTGWN